MLLDTDPLQAARLDHCYAGDCRDTMRQLIAQGVKVHTCVTSPPYFGLRDYQTGTWQDGDPNCDHVSHEIRTGKGMAALGAKYRGGGVKASLDKPVHYRDQCGKCGAVRIDRQIGLESSMDEYIATMVEVFRLVRDLLRDDGTCWINLGDSYAANRSYQVPSTLMNGCATNREQAGSGRGMKAAAFGLQPKDLMGIPWRVAFALQADGWILRQDIVWHKPNPMPESARDRCTKAHEYLFLLSKNPRYYYDQAAIREPCVDNEMANGFRGGAYCDHATLVNGEGGKRKTRGNYITPAGWDTRTGEGGHGNFHKDGRATERSHNEASGMRNKRSVWTVASEGFSDAHFATFPSALIEPAILAGAPPGGIVLDPFLGSGTTAMVAQRLGRRWIGCELNPDYLKLQARRTAQAGLILETGT